MIDTQYVCDKCNDSSDKKDGYIFVALVLANEEKITNYGYNMESAYKQLWCGNCIKESKLYTGYKTYIHDEEERNIEMEDKRKSFGAQLECLLSDFVFDQTDDMRQG